MKKLFHILDLFIDRLYKRKNGFVILSLVIAFIFILLGILENKQSIWMLLFTSFFYSPFLAAIIFLIKKHGWGKSLDFSIHLLMILGEIAISCFKLCSYLVMQIIYRYKIHLPFQWTWRVFYKTPKKFLTKGLPDKLPPVLRPLYRFSWHILFASLAYYAMWRFFINDTNPDYFSVVNIKGVNYRLTKAGVYLAGYIIFLGSIDFFFSYLGIFWNWLGKFKWNIRFIFHW